ncbi:MAG: hypothetical protein E6Q83_13795 [Thiothrix sp.]|nr:MAG: hypothetical protein E6Q83_13795 [Thiothrix sp.]
MATQSTTAVFDGAKNRYPDFLHAIQTTFKNSSKDGLFTTDAPELWHLFLKHLPEEVRQEYTCSACRHFVNHFGSLVRIDNDGSTHSALWHKQSVPAFFQASVAAMQQAVEQASVTGVFVSSLEVYGKPHTGHWRHMALTPAKKMIWQSLFMNAGQYRAKKLEEFKMLSRALNEFSAATVDTAVRLLRSDKLYRSEKVLGVAEWLKDLYATLNHTPNIKLKTHQQWLAVAKAPEGFCHVRSSMIGSLLEDIELGFEYEEIRARFAEKMHPLQYQRPQTAPSAGNIQQAEKIIEQLKAKKALERRYARLDELKLFWQPKAKPLAKNSKTLGTNTGVFADLVAKQSTASQALELPTETMTWEKFQRKVLPNALKIELLIKNKQRLELCALTTAVHADAPPILQWDHLEQRNPFSVYLYHGGSEPSHWGLKTGFVEVTGLCKNPPHWYKDLSHHHKGMIFILSKARDLARQTAGLALFPETLKSEFHPIRKTIEAFSKQGKLQGFEESSACGLFMNSNGALNHRLRVTTELGAQEYLLDRWD